MNIKQITTKQLVKREWRTGISNREELNAMDWDKLMQAIGVSISDDVCVECTDTYYDSLHREYVVSFSIME